MTARILLVLTAVTVLLLPHLGGQTPATAVVPAQVAAPAIAPVPDDAASVTSALKFLLEMKAANDATLKTQAAQLATLDDLQKAAEEIKIYSKRG